MNYFALTRWPLAACLALPALSGGVARADDLDGFHGYLRAGAGLSSTHGPQSCYSLGGDTVKYRLGNECDSYTKFGYTQELAQSDGINFVGTLWVSAYSPQSDFTTAKLGMNKAYVEAKNIPALNGGSAWIGLRDYLWSDIHMLDMWYIDLNGSSTGGGLDHIKFGPGMLAYAVFKDNDTTTRDPVSGAVINSSAATRQNFIYQDLPLNPNGTLDTILTLVSAQGGPDKHNGWQLTLSHKQTKVYGGVNTLVAQYGVGPGTGTGRGAGDYDRVGPSGSTSLGPDVTQLRVFDHLWIQPLPFFGLDFVTLMERDKSDAGGTTTWTAIGGRPVYALSNSFKLQMEIGIDSVSSPTGGEAKRLTKVTFAPTLSAGPGLWSRPELRAFVTYGRWNNAATASVNAANNSGPVYNNNTSGTSVGIQAETWF